jgi:proteasome lid subunit RPN8/RPN11
MPGAGSAREFSGAPGNRTDTGGTWGMMRAVQLHCEPGIVEAIRAHAQRMHPAEACGLLVGRADGGGRRAIAYVPVTNLDAASGAFRIDPFAWVAHEAEARALGTTIVGVAHSHPRGVAELSHADRQGAWPEHVQVVVGARLELRAYARHADAWHRIAIRVPTTSVTSRSRAARS